MAGLFNNLGNAADLEALANNQPGIQPQPNAPAPNNSHPSTGIKASSSTGPADPGSAANTRTSSESSPIAARTVN